MSAWTHVNCNFRLADYNEVTDEDIYKVFGKQLLWGEKFNRDVNYLPRGSEGSLHINIFRENKDLDISVFGDLRDYEDFDGIGDWFNKCCNSFGIKQAYCQVIGSGGFGENFECQKLVSNEIFKVNISFRIDGSPKYQYIKEELIDKCPYFEEMNINIWENPDESCLASTTLVMSGDFDLNAGVDFNMRVNKWFNDSLKKFNIRQAFCQINYANEYSKVHTNSVTFQRFKQRG